MKWGVFLTLYMPLRILENDMHSFKRIWLALRYSASYLDMLFILFIMARFLMLQFNVLIVHWNPSLDGSRSYSGKSLWWKGIVLSRNCEPCLFVACNLWFVNLLLHLLHALFPFAFHFSSVYSSKVRSRSCWAILPDNSICICI